MPRQDPVQMLRSLVIRGFATWDSALPEPTVNTIGVPVVGPITEVRRAYRTALGHWETVEQTIDGAEARALTIVANVAWTEKARSDALVELIATAGGEARQASAQLRDVLDTTADRLRSALVPPRPMPADAAQEAALANLRADLAMVLDRLAQHEIGNRLIGMIEDAHATGDHLTRWFLAATPWPARYLESRGVHPAEWKHELAEVLARVGDDPETTKALLRVLDAIESPKGMLGAAAGLDAWIRNRLDLVVGSSKRPVEHWQAFDAS